MDDIIKIVFERNKERKLLTSDDVKNICFNVINKKGYDFVKNVELFDHNPNDSDCAGVYYGENIFFFFREMVNLLTMRFEDFTDNYTIEGANVDVYNYFYLNVIFHELAHVRQYSISKGKRDSLEKKLFSMFLKLSGNRDFYNENYSDILTEVNANNVSVMTTNYIYSKLPRNFLTIDDWKTYQLFLLKTLFYDNYTIMPKEDEIISPSERVMSKFDEEILSNLNTTTDDCTKLIYDTNNLTIYKKLMLGLPINYNEYSYVNLVGGRINGDEEINAIKKMQKKLNR